MRCLAFFAGLLGLGLLSSVAAPQAAQAARPPMSGSAQVTSVDGPGLLTLRRKDRDIKVRLLSVDVPRPGECGAVETTAALRGFVARAPRRVQFSLTRLPQGGLARDDDGRYLASVTYPVRRYEFRDFANDLQRAEWGRPGVGASIDEPPGSGASVEDMDSEFENQDVLGLVEPRARRGLWARCGGRAHLRADEPVPASAPVTWAIDEHGITTKVGPLTLSPTLSPSTSPTLLQLSTLAPTEITRFSGVCRAWLPALQIRAYAEVPNDAPCSGGIVWSISTIGPEGAPLARGGAVGRPAADLGAAFPLLVSEKSATTWSLSGPVSRPWAWKTEAKLSPDGTLAGLAAYASPLR